MCGPGLFAVEARGSSLLNGSGDGISGLGLDSIYNNCLQLILPRDSDLNAAPLGKATGVYHFALECPSGRLIGFSRLCGKSDFQLEDGRTATVCVKVARISADFER